MKENKDIDLSSVPRNLLPLARMIAKGTIRVESGDTQRGEAVCAAVLEQCVSPRLSVRARCRPPHFLMIHSR